MTQVLRKVFRLATLLLGMSIASVALAVATVDVTYTGPQAKINDTTIKLVDSSGAEVKPEGDNRNRFVLLPGTDYSVRVYRADGTEVGRRILSFAEGNSQVRVDAETGALLVVPVAAAATVTPVKFDFLNGARPVGYSISAGGGVVKDTAPTAGVNLVTGTPLLQGSSKIDTANLDGSFSLIKEGAPLLRFDAGGSWGDRSTSGEVPTGTSAGYVFWQPQVITTPTGGTSTSTGVSSSQGWETHIKSNFWESHLDGALHYPFWQPSPWIIGAEPLIGYQHLEYRYRSSIVNETLPGLSSDTDQLIKEDDFRLGYGFWKRYAFANGGWAEGLLAFNLVYYHARYSGTQNNLCSFCRPPLLTEFDVSTSDGQRRGTWGVHLQETLGFPIAQNAELRVSAMYRYQDKTPIIVNNVLSSDQAPHLGSHSRQSANMQAGFSANF